jgi:hypothetical protein
MGVLSSTFGWGGDKRGADKGTSEDAPISLTIGKY